MMLREKLEARVQGGLRNKLLHPDLIAAFVDEYRKAFNAAVGDRNNGSLMPDASSASRMISGAVLPVDGGFLAV